MLIVPFNAQNLSQQTVQSLKERIKQYFQQGPGKECPLHSVYFQNLYFYFMSIIYLFYTSL